MRSRERWEYLSRAPVIGWDLLARGRHRFQYDLMPVTVQGMSIASRLNLVRSGLNLLWRRLKPWSWPLHMQIELTSYCDLECPVWSRHRNFCAPIPTSTIRGCTGAISSASTPSPFPR